MISNVQADDRGAASLRSFHQQNFSNLAVLTEVLVGTQGWDELGRAKRVTSTEKPVRLSGKHTSSLANREPIPVI